LSPGGGNLLGFHQKVFPLISPGRGKVMGLVLDANNKNRRGRVNGIGREVIYLHISLTSSKRQLAYG